MSQRSDPAAAALRPLEAPAPLRRPPAGGEWDLVLRQAAVAVKSGLLPREVNTPEKAAIIALVGQELGLPLMLSLRSIYVVNGRPVLSADLLASLVYRAIDRKGDGLLQPLPPTAERATVRYRRWGQAEIGECTFTIEDAQRAGLAGRETWKQYPAQMLRARAVAMTCRLAFPDVVAGLSLPDELPPESDLAAWPGDDWPDPPLGEPVDALPVEVVADDRLATPEQLAAIAALVVEAGIEDVFPVHLKGEYAVEETTDLSWAQATELVARLELAAARRTERGNA